MSPHAMARAVTRGVAVVGLVTLIGCGIGPPDPEAPISTAVVNDPLGIRLATVPADFEVEVNAGDRLELVPSEPSVGGRIVFSVGEEDESLNLIAAVKRHQQRIEELPEGEYKGGQELVTPTGPAFYSRGRYLAGLTETEQTEIYLVHPLQSRLLTLSYTYPAGGDSSVRVQQLLDVLGYLEGAMTEESSLDG